MQSFRKRYGKTANDYEKWFFAAILPSFFWLVFSCTAANYGKLQSSNEITNMFDSDQVLSDYVYYYSGLDGVPNAIIGIHKDYSLRSKLWRRVDLTPAMLKKWVSRMSFVQDSYRLLVLSSKPNQCPNGRGQSCGCGSAGATGIKRGSLIVRYLASA